MFRKPSDFLLVPLIAILTVVFVGWGGYSTYVAVRNWSPTEVTCAELAEHPPNAEWLRLTDCEADFERMAVDTMRRTRDAVATVVQVYLPLRARGGKGRAAIVLVGDDADMLALGGSMPSQAAVDRVAAQLDQPIEGLAVSAIAMSAVRRHELQGLSLGLADDFVVIDRDARPRPLWLAIPVLLLGIGGFALLRRRVLRARRRRPAELARAKIVSG